METVKLNAENRDKTGKGPARRMRAKGMIPAVCYGRGTDTISLMVSPKALKDALSGSLGLNAVLELDLSGKRMTAMVVDYQVHPVTRALLHADFKLVDEARPVDVEVPIEFVGKAKGIVLGGRLRQVFRELPVRCLPQDIPAKLSHDVTELLIEDTVQVKDLQLPAGLQVRLRPEQTLGGVYGARATPGDEGEEKKPEGAAEAKAK